MYVPPFFKTCMEPGGRNTSDKREHWRTKILRLVAFTKTLKTIKSLSPIYSSEPKSSEAERGHHWNKVWLSLESGNSLETCNISLSEEWKSIKIYLSKRLIHLRKAHVHWVYLEEIREYRKSRNTRVLFRRKTTQHLWSFKNQVSSMNKL